MEEEDCYKPQGGRQSFTTTGNTWSEGYFNPKLEEEQKMHVGSQGRTLLLPFGAKRWRFKQESGDPKLKRRGTRRMKMKTVLKKSGGKNWWCMAEEEGSWVGIKGEDFTFRDTHFEA